MSQNPDEGAITPMNGRFKVAGSSSPMGSGSPLLKMSRSMK